MDDPWYQDGLRFRCTRCGNCCTGAPGFVWVNDEEIAAIADYLGQPLTHVLARLTRPVDSRRRLRSVRSERPLLSLQGVGPRAVPEQSGGRSLARSSAAL